MHLYFITLFKAVNTSISAVRVIMWHKSHTYPCISNRSTCLRKWFKEVLFIPLYCEALIPERQFPNPPKENPAVSTKENSWKILCVTESSLQFLLSYSVHSISLNQKNCLFFFFFLRSSNKFPAVAEERRSLGWDPSESLLVHTLRGSPAAAWEKPNPLCDVMVSDFSMKREEALPSRTLTSDNSAAYLHVKKKG